MATLAEDSSEEQASMCVMRTSCLVVLLATTLASAQETIPELVRQHGAISQFIFNSWVPIGVTDLLSCSDLILEVRVVSANSHLAADETEIHTDYPLRILEAIRPEEKKLVGSNIFLTRGGGNVVIEGHLVEASDPEFPQFKAGDQYVVFLKFDKKTGQHNFCGGPQGAYRVHGTKIEPLAQFGGAASEFKNKSRAELLELLRRASSSGNHQPQNF